MKSFVSIIALVVLTMACTEAAPIVYTSTQNTTGAFAGVDTTTDGPSNDASPPLSLPINSTASVATSDGRASASSTADLQSLIVSTTAVAINLSADASAVATFTGEFVVPVAPGFSFFFDLDTVSAGDAFGTLAITLDVAGTALFDGIFTATETLEAFIPIPAALVGLAGIFDLTLISVANANPGDVSASSASVQFTLNGVPEPPVAFDLLLGSGLIAMFRLRPARRSS